MIEQQNITKDALHRLLKNGTIVLAGHRKLKIYGTLQCWSGKKMDPNNRVFFFSQSEALKQGYRPCGHCMTTLYQTWKKIQNT